MSLTLSHAIGSFFSNIAAEPYDFGLVRRDEFVASHTQALGRNSRRCRAAHTAMAVLTGNLVLSGVYLVAERDRLAGTRFGTSATDPSHAERQKDQHSTYRFLLHHFFVSWGALSFRSSVAVHSLRPCVCCLIESTSAGATDGALFPHPDRAYVITAAISSFESLSWKGGIRLLYVRPLMTTVSGKPVQENAYGSFVILQQPIRANERGILTRDPVPMTLVAGLADTGIDLVAPDNGCGRQLSRHRGFFHFVRGDGEAATVPADVETHSEQKEHAECPEPPGRPLESFFRLDLLPGHDAHVNPADIDRLYRRVVEAGRSAPGLLRFISGIVARHRFDQGSGDMH